QNAFATPTDLSRFAGSYRDGARVVRVTSEDGALVMRPGVRHRASSQLVDTGGGAFVALDDPSYEVRFQMQDSQTRGYSRYRNGWFFGSVAVRSDPLEAPEAKAKSAKAAP